MAATQNGDAHKLPDFKSPYWWKPEVWDVAAADFTQTVGRVTFPAGAKLIELAHASHPLDQPASTAVDLGAGTGAISLQLAERFPRLSILATDTSSGMLAKLQADYAAHRQRASRTSPVAGPEASGGVPEEEEEEEEETAGAGQGDGKMLNVKLVDLQHPLTDDDDDHEGNSHLAAGDATHLFCSFCVQIVPFPSESGVLDAYRRVLKDEDSVLALSVFELAEEAGPHRVWGRAARAVDATYVAPPMLRDGAWVGLAAAVRGLEEAGFTDIRTEVADVNFGFGTEGFMWWFWDSKNPMPRQRMATFDGDLDKVKVAMRELLDEEYDGGRNVPFKAGLIVAKRGKVDASQS